MTLSARISAASVERDPPILVGDITPFVHHLPLRKPTIKVKRLAIAAAVKVKDGE